MELVTNELKTFKYKELNKGDVLVQEGVYLESKPDKFGGTSHFFEEVNGERVCLWSAKQLNYLVDAHLREGIKCKIEYNGEIVLEKGMMKGKPCHQFKLYKERTTLAPAEAKQTEMNLDDLE